MARTRTEVDRAFLAVDIIVNFRRKLELLFIVEGDDFATR